VVRGRNRLELAGRACGRRWRPLAAVAPGLAAGAIDKSWSRCTGDGSTRSDRRPARPPGRSWRCGTARTATTSWRRCLPWVRPTGCAVAGRSTTCLPRPARPAEHAIDAGYTFTDLLLAVRAQGNHPARAAAGRHLSAGPHRRIHRRGVHYRLGPPAGQVPERRNLRLLTPCRRNSTNAVAVKVPAATCRSCPAGTGAPARLAPAGSCPCAHAGPRGRPTGPRGAGHRR
jgi:hypothetical protein